MGIIVNNVEKDSFLKPHPHIIHSHASNRHSSKSLIAHSELTLCPIIQKIALLWRLHLPKRRDTSQPCGWFLILDSHRL